MFEDENYGEENLLVSTKTEYDVEENVLRPKVWRITSANKR